MLQNRHDKSNTKGTLLDNDTKITFRKRTFDFFLECLRCFKLWDNEDP